MQKNVGQLYFSKPSEVEYKINGLAIAETKSDIAKLVISSYHVELEIYIH